MISNLCTMNFELSRRSETLSGESQLSHYLCTQRLLNSLVDY